MNKLKRPAQFTYKTTGIKLKKSNKKNASGKYATSPCITSKSWSWMQSNLPKMFFFVSTSLVDLLNKQRVCLAYKQVMPVNVQPVRWLQSLMLPPKLDATLTFVNFLYTYIHRVTSSPFHHLETINKMVNWFHATTTEQPTNNWVKDEPCIAR